MLRIDVIKRTSYCRERHCRPTRGSQRSSTIIEAIIKRIKREKEKQEYLEHSSEINGGTGSNGLLPVVLHHRGNPSRKLRQKKKKPEAEEKDLPTGKVRPALVDLVWRPPLPPPPPIALILNLVTAFVPRKRLIRN
jgi:hypothetical protein